MLIFALFTLGYFAGVFTALTVFPPQVKEIEEQEKATLEPILRTEAQQLVQKNEGQLISPA